MPEIMHESHDPCQVSQRFDINHLLQHMLPLHGLQQYAWKCQQCSDNLNWYFQPPPFHCPILFYVKIFWYLESQYLLLNLSLPCSLILMEKIHDIWDIVTGYLVRCNVEELQGILSKFYLTATTVICYKYLVWRGIDWSIQFFWDTATGIILKGIT